MKIFFELQDLSNNSLRDISAVNALPHLLTLRVDHNMLTSARLEEVRDVYFYLFCVYFFAVTISSSC